MAPRLQSSQAEEEISISGAVQGPGGRVTLGPGAASGPGRAAQPARVLGLSTRMPLAGLTLSLHPPVLGHQAGHRPAAGFPD